MRVPGNSREAELNQRLAEMGVVCAASGGEGCWRLTEAGKAKLLVGLPIHDMVPAFRPAAEISPSATTYQLLWKLADEGWQHKVAFGSDGRHARRTPYKAPGVDGPGTSDKVWYTKRGMHRVSSWYLLALLLANDHKQRVYHLQAASVYQALVDPDLGPCQAKAHKRRAAVRFDPDLCDEYGWPEDALDLPPKRQRRASGAAPVAEDTQEELIGSTDEEAAGTAYDEASDGGASLFAPSASDSEGSRRSSGAASAKPLESSASSCSSSSSSSSESGTSDTGSSHTDDEDAPSNAHDMDLEAAAEAEAAVKNAEEDAVSVGGDGPEVAESEGGARRRTSANVVRWGIIPLTPKLTNGAITSWQITCRCPGHVSCNRARSVSACASADECIRMLKTWALYGKSTATKAEHKDKWAEVQRMVAAGELPTMGELDAQTIRDLEAYQANPA